MIRSAYWCLSLILLGVLPYAECLTAQESWTPWKPGWFDIHHIHTGRGNATFMIFPDGTSMLIDAGDISDTHPRTISDRNSVRVPNDSKTSGGWIADYIRAFAPRDQDVYLDYALITHYHDDHFGEWDPHRPKSSKGNYVLTGMTEVGDLIPIRRMMDRGDDFPVSFDDPVFRQSQEKDEYHILQSFDNYRAFTQWSQQHTSMEYAPFIPGTKDQIVMLKNPSAFPEFEVYNLAVNGILATGFDTPRLDTLYRAGQYPGENPLSTCLRFRYGAFDYFTGGDISGVNPLGESDQHSIESKLAPVIGAVDMATLNHHGNRDAMNTYFVRTLRPRVWIGQTWSSDHPGHDVLRRITSASVYPGPRDVYATDMLPANYAVIGDMINSTYAPAFGHVVVRVYAGGHEYDVFVLDARETARPVLFRSSRYTSR